MVVVGRIVVVVGGSVVVVVVGRGRRRSRRRVVGAQHRTRGDDAADGDERDRDGPEDPKR